MVSARVGLEVSMRLHFPFSRGLPQAARCLEGMQAGCLHGTSARPSPAGPRKVAHLLGFSAKMILVGTSFLGSTCGPQEWVKVAGRGAVAARWACAYQVSLSSPPRSTWSTQGQPCDTWEEDRRAAETADTRLVQFYRRTDLRALARASVVICSFYKPY